MKTDTIADKDTIYTVSQITTAIRHELTKQFSSTWVKGEISDLFVASSGHVYLSLKDENSQIRCAMFRKQNRRLAFQPANGLEVVVRAQADIYQPRGDLQLVIAHMEPAGFGKLQIKFEELKQKLKAEGLFDEARKKAIPEWPNSIGIITSPKGAALHDTLSTLKNRCAAIDIIIYPTPVQGNDAPAGICQMLKIADRRREVDVLLLVRGGGSLEDLQAFNEEIVARQMAETSIPIVTGVGHEIDFTIADFVGDFRAPTPTAAAVKASPNLQTFESDLGKHETRLKQFLSGKIEYIASRLDVVETGLARFHPYNQIYDLSQKLDVLQQQMTTAIRNFLHLMKQSFDQRQLMLTYFAPDSIIEKIDTTLQMHSRRITATACRAIADSKRSLEEINGKLRALSHYATLERGYSFVRDDKGRIVRSTRTIHSGTTVNVQLAKGEFDAVVKSTRHTKIARS